MTSNSGGDSAAKRFLAIRLTLDQAHHVWERSNEASTFTRPSHLAQLAEEVEWWGVERGGKLLAAWPLVRAQQGDDIRPPPFCYYVGPMFIRELREDRNQARAWNAYTESLRAMIEAIVKVHRSFSFSCPLGLHDLRVLSWWNFDHPSSENCFHITPRYTARIHLADFPDELALNMSFCSDRRRRIKRWAKTPPILVDDVSIDRLIELHDQTLRRTGGHITTERHRVLTRMIHLIRSGAGAILGFAPTERDAVEAVIVLLDGIDASNNVFCSASDNFVNTGLSAWALWQGMVRAQTMGMRWFDMNGANSPGRATDKHRYGARTELYFDCHFGCRF